MQRWSHDTPPSGKSGGGDAPQPSFLEVLLTGINARSAPAATKSPTQPASPCGASPRIVVRPYAPRRATSTTGPDADGWHPVVSRRTRKELHRMERRPRRPVPADLRGKCFNCLSPNHRATSCRSRARCFRCRALGHRTYDCPARHAAPAPTPRTKLVWRPVRTASSTPVSPIRQATRTSVPMVTTPPPGDGAGQPGQSLRRQRNRKRRGKRGNSSSTPP